MGLPMRKELDAALALAKTLPLEDLPVLAGMLEQIRFVILGRLAAPPQEREDKLLNVKQTAKRMHCSKDWLYRNHCKLPFARPHAVGGKLLFSSTGLDLYLKKSR
jgi:hypothetical protein